MASSKKPKKKYNPNKFKTPSGVERTWINIKTYKKLTPDEEAALMVIPNTKMAELSAGTGKKEAWFTVIARISFGLGLAEQLKYGEDVLKEFVEGLRIAYEIHERYESQGSDVFWVLTPEEDNQLSACIRAVDDLQKEASMAQLDYSVKRSYVELTQRYGLPVPADL